MKNTHFGKIDLCGTWRFRGFSKGLGRTKAVFAPDYDRRDFLPIQIPGTVRQGLLAAGEIPDPYFGFDNEKSLWVEEKEWWFCREFQVDSALNGKNIDILFSGAVFQGEVWLNGEALGRLQGMFNPRAFHIEERLHFHKPNVLAVRLEAPDDARRFVREHGLTFRFPGEERKQLHSMAQCLFGWDWAPHTVAIGIWQPVFLQYSGKLRLEAPQIRTLRVSESAAQIEIRCEVRNLSSRDTRAVLSGEIAGKNVTIPPVAFSQEIEVAANSQQPVQFSINIEQPRLWWPNGMGEQNLYALVLQVQAQGEVSHAITETFGIREIELVENEAVDEFIEAMKKNAGNVYRLGKVVASYPWTFRINGRKMFAKGANWIPIDHLLRLEKSKYRHLLRLAKDAHMNMLRVWGGGLFETDDFYQLCDEYGILTWQDFLSNQDISQLDRENFLEASQAAILRLRNHPSLALWCGGNEFDPDDAGSKATVDALQALVQKLDPQRPFHRASPYMGDDHYWGVWHGQEPYTAYGVVRPFRSEAGVNAFPVPENYRKFTSEERLWPPDKVHIEYHGEQDLHLTHVAKLSRYADEFGVSHCIEEFILKGQLYQALANQYNIEFCRAHKFKNSGVLFWQYNDSWPCVSWSLVDWYGTPKPAYYFLKRASRPVHLSADFRSYLWHAGDTLRATLYLHNDTPAALAGVSGSYRLLDVQGRLLQEASFPCEAGPDQAAVVADVAWTVPAAYRGKTVFLALQLNDASGQVLSESLYLFAVSQEKVSSSKLFYSQPNQRYFEVFSELQELPNVRLQCLVREPRIDSCKCGTGSFRVELSNPAPHLAFLVHVRLADPSAAVDAGYDDNDFSLLPGEKKQVTIHLHRQQPNTGPDRLRFILSGWNVDRDEFFVDFG